MELRRLPRLLRRTRAITALCRDELRISQAFADNAAERLNEAALVIILALVKPKRLLIAVTKKVERFDVHIRSFEGALQKRPKVFQSVRMDLAFGVALQVVNDLAVIILFEIVIGHERICADRLASFHVLADVAAKLWAAGVRNHFQNYARERFALRALKDALHGGFLNPGVTNACPAILVHVASLCADVGLIRFARPVHL